MFLYDIMALKTYVDVKGEILTAEWQHIVILWLRFIMASLYYQHIL